MSIGDDIWAWLTGAGRVKSRPPDNPPAEPEKPQPAPEKPKPKPLPKAIRHNTLKGRVVYNRTIHHFSLEDMLRIMRRLEADLPTRPLNLAPDLQEVFDVFKFATLLLSFSLSPAAFVAAKGLVDAVMQFLKEEIYG